MDEATKQKLRKLFIAALEEEKYLQEEDLQKLWDVSIEHHGNSNGTTTERKY